MYFIMFFVTNKLMGKKSLKNSKKFFFSQKKRIKIMFLFQPKGGGTTKFDANIV